jgi:hypothetical protein
MSKRPASPSSPPAKRAASAPVVLGVYSNNETVGSLFFTMPWPDAVAKPQYLKVYNFDGEDVEDIDTTTEHGRLAQKMALNMGGCDHEAHYEREKLGIEAVDHDDYDKDDSVTLNVVMQVIVNVTL